MEIAGYIASLLIGISLGLLGGGGSILTVPVLVYLFRVQPVLATAYSLFIVGSTSLVGSVPKFKLGEINLKTAIAFGIPSIVAVFATRAFIVPSIPTEVFTIGSVVVTKSLLMMVLFAVLMVFAAVSMIRRTALKEADGKQRLNYPVILAQGIIVGILSGLVGAGGGFLIIPALLLFSNLPIKQAIGTSLLIIAANSLIGFMGNPGKREMDWMLLLTITVLSIAGIFVGNWLSKKLSPVKIKKGFGWFVLVMGIYIMVKELVFFFQ